MFLGGIRDLLCFVGVDKGFRVVGCAASPLLCLEAVARCATVNINLIKVPFTVDVRVPLVV